MRKPHTVGFGTRGGVAPTVPAIEAAAPNPRWRWPNINVTISYGIAVKVAIVLWAVMIVAAMLWP
jgi:hypothetical protein